MSELLKLIVERGYRRGEFTLASGRTSDFFIDCKPAVLSARGHVLVGDALLAAISKHASAAVAVAGVAVGGCALASAVATRSANGPGLDAVYVRKAAKGHGSQKRIEGADGLAEGASIVLVEDTVTTGGSSIRAAQALQEAGFGVACVIAIVDRQEGAAEAFEAASLPFQSLFTREDILRCAGEDA